MDFKINSKEAMKFFIERSPFLSLTYNLVNESQILN